MEGVTGVISDAANVVTALAAVFGLFFLARQNGYLRSQISRPEPIVSVESSVVATWSDPRWRILTVTVHNPAQLPLHWVGIAVDGPCRALLWQYGAALVPDHYGNSALGPRPPATDGQRQLSVDATVGGAVRRDKPGPGRAYTHLIMRVDESGQNLPKLRCTYRWKDSAATVKAIVATIWDRDAAT